MKNRLLYGKVFATYWDIECYHKEQVDLMISRSNVARYSWILHDKDTDFVTRLPKKPHYHVLIKFERNQRGSWFNPFCTE